MRKRPTARDDAYSCVFTADLLPATLDSVARCSHLPRRQRQLLELAAVGLTEAEIALALGLARATVNHYRRRAMKRLGARSITHAVFIAMLLGLLFTDV